MGGEQDPIDAMDLSDMGQMVAESETAIPDSMILGGARGDESTATAGEEETTGEETAETAADRDANGRFKAKEGEEEATTEETPDGEQPAKPVKRSPFEYRAVGANHTLPGAELDDAGNLTIKAEQVGTVRQALNAFHLAQSGQDAVLPAIRARDAQIAEISAKHQDASLLATIAESLITEAEAAFMEPDEEKALNAFYALRQQWGAKMATAESKYWKAQAERGRGKPDRATTNAASREDPSKDVAASALPSTEDALATTTEYVEQMKFLPNYRTALTPQDWKQYAERIARMPYAFLRPATAAEAQEKGLRTGQTVFDTDKLKQDVDDFVSSRALARKKAQSQTGLAAQNARRTQPAITAPPTPGSGKQPVGAKKSGDFGSEKEVDDWLGNDKL